MTKLSAVLKLFQRDALLQVEIKDNFLLLNKNFMIFWWEWKIAYCYSIKTSLLFSINRTQLFITHQRFHYFLVKKEDSFLLLNKNFTIFQWNQKIASLYSRKTLLLSPNSLRLIYAIGIDPILSLIIYNHQENQLTFYKNLAFFKRAR